MRRRIKIFDTTLRDGEQCPGASLNAEEKLEVARQLARLGVDIIEAGFAIASPGDFEAIRSIAREVQGPVICSLSRAKEIDIQRAWDAIREAPRRRIHTFLATSPIHMEYKLRMKPEEVLKTSVAMVKFAKGLCEDVEFSPEDAGRSERPFLFEVIAAVIEAGATVVNIPDTVGYTTPEEFGGLIRAIFENVKVPKHVDISCHCHNDLGMAVANSLAAVKNGATQVECTVNGIGERAGNASLEEIVMAIKTRADYFTDCETGVNTREIYKSSRLVSHLTGMLVQPNKAIIGANAFAHESGIHQAGMIRFQQTYEIMKPEEIGLTSGQLVLGKHSGRHAFVQKIKELGYEMGPEAVDAAFAKFKELADKKKEVSSRDIETLISEKKSVVPETYQLESVQVSSGTHERPTATVKILHHGKSLEITETGDGPVDAVFKGITQLTKTASKLVDYTIQAITGGTDAIGEVTIRIEESGQIFSGHGAHTDIIISSAQAYLHALNKLVNARTTGIARLKPTEVGLTP